MNFDGDDIQAAYFCVAQAIRARHEIRRPIPAELSRLYHRLNLAIGCLSELGQANSDNPSESTEDDDWLTTRQVAQLVNCSTRTAQRLAERELGQFIGGRWLCRRSVVESYLEDQRNAS